MKPALNSTGNIEGLQVLRAVAALMVVLHHARLSVPGSEAWPSFGAAGVDIFFVISGFVMAYTTSTLWSREPGGKATPSPLRAAGIFLRKRAIRVVPLYWLALLWTSRRELIHGQVSTDLAKDFLFIPHPNSVFHGWLAPTLQQGWTLNYEAFFYLLFALSMLFGTVRITIVLCTLVAFVLAGYVLAHMGWPADIDNAAGIARRFYGDNIILEFGYGILIERALFARPSLPWPRWVYAVILALGFLALALTHDMPPRAMTEGLAAAVIVWAGVRACSGVRVPTLELLGAASYSIYLFHWASFGAVKPLAAAMYAVPNGWMKVTILMSAHIAIAIVAGLIIHVVVEKPLMRWASRKFGGNPKRIPAVLSA